MAASGVRISWMQIPVRVRAGIEAIIGGGAVITAVSQSGGFSPGTADRVVTADGRRALSRQSAAPKMSSRRACTELKPTWSVNSLPLPSSPLYSASTTTVRGLG